MHSSFKNFFFLKNSKRQKSGSLPIYVRILVDGKRAEMSIQRSWDSKKWNQKSHRAVGNSKEAHELNSFLDTIQGRIFEIQKEYTLKNQPLSSHLVVQKLTSVKSDKYHSIVEVFQYHNDQFEKLVGIEFSNGTFKKFKTALSSLKTFIESKYQLTDLNLQDINHQFLTEFEFYLKSVRKMQHNSAMGIQKKLKKILRQCQANDWLDKDPFKSYKITTKETHRNYLTAEELQLLVNKNFHIERMQVVKDIFLFSCYTGLSYSDIMELIPDHLCIGIDGERWIYTRRTKTRTDSRIPLLPIANEILTKYSSHASVVNKHKLLPSLSNQRLNSYLKEIADVCSFNKQLTFHCARHTFATTVTLTNGVPIETVGKMLGHKNIRTTQIYAKIIDRKVSEDMRELKNKLGSRSLGRQA